MKTQYKILSLAGISALVIYFLLLRSKKRTSVPAIYNNNNNNTPDTEANTETNAVNDFSSPSSIVPPSYTSSTPTSPRLPLQSLEEARQKAIATKSVVRFQNYYCYPEGYCTIGQSSSLGQSGGGAVAGGSSAPASSGGGGFSNNDIPSYSILWQIPGSSGAGGGQILGSYQMSSTPSSKKSAIGVSRYF